MVLAPQLGHQAASFRHLFHSTAHTCTRTTTNACAPTDPSPSLGHASCWAVTSDSELGLSTQPCIHDTTPDDQLDTVRSYGMIFADYPREIGAVPDVCEVKSPIKKTFWKEFLRGSGSQIAVDISTSVLNSTQGQKQRAQNFCHSGADCPADGRIVIMSRFGHRLSRDYHSGRHGPCRNRPTAVNKG